MPRREVGPDPMRSKWWFRVAWRMLQPLRKKYPREWRAMRGRLAGPKDWPFAWRNVCEAMNRVRVGALASTTGRHYHTSTDADRLCALVIETVVWWAVKDRDQVAAIRDAAGKLLALQERIDAAVTELCEAVPLSRELSEQFGLQVNHPMWRDELGEVLSEARERFIRWGLEPEVRALADLEHRSWYSPRPGVLDLVQIARNVGAVHTAADWKPLRNSWTREWMRPYEPWVSARDLQAEKALAFSGGSDPKSERAQVRQLLAALQELGNNNGWIEGAPGPLEFLTDADLSVLCTVAVGPVEDSKLKKSDPFDVGNMRKARDAFKSR